MILWKDLGEENYGGQFKKKKPLTFYFEMLIRVEKYANIEERFQNKN